MVLLELTKESIDSLCLLMHGGLAAVSRLNQWPVVVPLDVRNVVGRQNCIDLTEHMLVAIWVREIQHKLASTSRWHSSPSTQNPVWMRSV